MKVAAARRELDLACPRSHHSRPELGELEEAWRPGKVGSSSTMPHKRNPEECEPVVVLPRLAAAQVPLALQGMIGEHERDLRSLRLEWSMVVDVSHYSLATLAISRQILAGLIVHEDVMATNAEEAAGEVYTESLMLALGRHLGKQSAHTHVYELCQDATGEVCLSASTFGARCRCAST